MRRSTLAIGFVLVASSFPPTASADPTTAVALLPRPSTTAPGAVSNASSGLAVVALPGATDAAWPLAQAVYADMSLGAGRVDEAHARVLCGEPPSADAAAELQDLAENVGALRGDDAPSRALLAAIARRMSVTAVVVVRVDAGHPVARVFLADTGVFDAAAYAPDDTAARSWVGTVRSLARVLGTQATTAPLRPPALATHDGPRIENSPPSRRHFYESGWFWGAIGAAAFAGGAIYFAARDSGSPTIHLEMQVPR